MFNNRYLVAVVEAIGDHEQAEFTTRQIAQQCGLADSLVRAVMLRLVAAGLVVEHTRRGGVRGERPYRVRTDAGWELLVPLCRRLAS